MPDEITYSLPLFPRLEPVNEWAGGNLAGTDLVTLDDAARFASRHAGAEVTPADILRAAARGQIPLRAVCPRPVVMQPTREGRKAIDIPAGALPTLPLAACQALSATGRASWRGYDTFEPVEELGGELGRYEGWRLPEGEADLVSIPSDCRMTGREVHALADAFKEPAAETTQDDARHHGNVPSEQAYEAEPTPKPAPKSEQARPLEDWKMRVQAEAAAEWKRLRAMGCNPTRYSIRGHVYKWCLKNDIRTSSRINPSDGYLRTWVLSAQHWTPPTD